MLWGLREMQRTIAASPVKRDTGWGQTVHRAKRGVDGRRLFLQGNGKKKGILGGAAPALGFVFIFMYLFSELWTKKGLWGSPF